VSETNSTYAPKGTSLEDFFSKEQDDPVEQELLRKRREARSHAEADAAEVEEGERASDSNQRSVEEASKDHTLDALAEHGGFGAGAAAAASAVKPNPGIMPGAARILGKRLLGGLAGGPIGAAALPAALDFMEDPKGNAAQMGETLGANQAANLRKNLEARRTAPSKITGIAAPGPKHANPAIPDWHF